MRRSRPFLGELVDYEMMRAFSSELRVEVLAVICERGVASPKEISQRLEHDLSHVSGEVQALKRYGLIVMDHYVLRASSVEHFYKVAVPGALSLTPLILDPAGLEGLRRVTDDFKEAVLDLQAGAKRRMSAVQGGGERPVSTTVFLASFLSARSVAEGFSCR